MINEIDVRGLAFDAVNDIIKNLEPNEEVTIEILRNYDREYAREGVPLPPVSVSKGYCHLWV